MYLKTILATFVLASSAAFAETDYLALPVAQSNKARLDIIDRLGPQIAPENVLYNMVKVPASSIMLRGATSDPDWVDASNGGGFYSYGFDADTVESVHFIVPLPNDYKVDTPIVPFICWSTGNSSETGDVRWYLTVNGSDNGGVIANTNNSTEALVVAAASGLTTLSHHSFSSVDITSTSDFTISNQSGVLVFRLARLGDEVDDTLEADAVLLYFGFRYQVDKFAIPSTELGPFGQ